MVTMDINVDKVCYVISLARRRAGKVPPVYQGGDDLSKGVADDPGGDSPLAPIIDYPGDPGDVELGDFLKTLASDEMAALLAVSLVGRDDYDAEGWDDGLAEAQESLERGGDAVRRLLDEPDLAEFLTNGLQKLDYECPEDTAEHGAAGPGRETPTGGGR